MLTATPRLEVRRPSPTAAEFSVTTLPPPSPLLRLARALLAALRLAVATAVLLALGARWAAEAAAYAGPPSPGAVAVAAAGLRRALDAWQRSAAGALAARLPPPLLLGLAAAALGLAARRVHARESLLVLRGLGVQTSGSAPSYLSAASTRFIPTEKIHDIFVNEAFRGFEVRYYLVIVVDGEDDVVVVFPGLLPPRAIVETVWRGARECLYEGCVEDKA